MKAQIRSRMHQQLKKYKGSRWSRMSQKRTILSKTHLNYTEIRLELEIACNKKVKYPKIQRKCQMKKQANVKSQRFSKIIPELISIRSSSHLIISLATKAIFQGDSWAQVILSHRSKLLFKTILMLNLLKKLQTT